MKSLYSFIIIIVFIIVINIIIGNAAAQTATPTPKVTETQDQDRIEKIKDLVASKVAELKLVEKKAVLGTVKSATNTQITLLDHKNQQRAIDIDELTKFQSNKESFGISDISSGDVISAIGLYNKDTKRLLARFVSQVTSVPENFDGAVVAKDKVSFSITFLTQDNKKRVIDIETSTRTSLYDGAETQKSGFSKIEIGQRVIVVGFKDPKEKDRINASRIIHFLSIPISSQMKKFIDLSREEVPASTGSAGKVLPIIKR